MDQYYGASIERGVVSEVCEDGYKVQSYTRDGIMTSAIASISGETYDVGDRVYFFVFDDGRGAIIAEF